MKKRPPTRVLCARVKKIYKFFRENREGRRFSKTKRRCEKNTFSLIRAYVFFANQKEEAVFLRRPLLRNLLVHYSENSYRYGIGLLACNFHQLLPELAKIFNRRDESHTGVRPIISVKPDRFGDFSRYT